MIERIRKMNDKYLGKTLVAKPEGWPTTLQDCRPGAFIFFNKDTKTSMVGFKSKYTSPAFHGCTDQTKNTMDVYCDDGSYCILTHDESVTSLEFEWEEL